MSLTYTLMAVVGMISAAMLGIAWRFAYTARSQLQQAKQTQQEINTNLRTALQEIRELAGQSALLAQTHADRDFKALAYLSGESSFCYVEPSPCSTAPYSWLPVVIQHGNYPCYDVDIRIVDLHKVQTVNKNLPLYERQQITDCVLSLGTMPPNRTKALTEHRFSALHKQGFDIYITARNGYYLQQLRFAKVGKQWTYAYTIKQYRKGSFSKMIRRHSEPNFPKQKKITAVDC